MRKDEKMEKATLRFGSYERVLSGGVDGTVIRFTFSIAFSEADEDLIGATKKSRKMNPHILQTSIADTLSASWGIGEADLVLALFAIGRGEIVARLLHRGYLSSVEEVVVQQWHDCPSDPKRLPHPDGFEEIVTFDSKIES